MKTSKTRTLSCVSWLIKFVTFQAPHEISDRERLIIENRVLRIKQRNKGNAMIISIRTTKSFDIENLLLALSKKTRPRLIESWHQDTDFDLELDQELGYPLTLSAPCYFRIAIDSEGSPANLLTWILDSCQHLDPNEKYIEVEFNDDECKSHGFFEERFLNSRLPMTGTTFNLQDI